MTLDKGASLIAVIIFAVTIAVAYTNLNNRLDNMNNEMAGIKDTLGSAACNAILPRQIEAIEKNRKDAREALEALSKQYDCGPRQVAAHLPSGTGRADAMQMNVSADADLNAQLNSVDVLLKNESNASGAHQ